MLIALSYRGYAQTNPTTDLLINGSWKLQNITIKGNESNSVNTSDNGVSYKFMADGKLSVLKSGAATASMKWKYLDATYKLIVIYADESSTWGYNVTITSINSSSLAYSKKFQSEGITPPVNYEAIYSFIKI